MTSLPKFNPDQEPRVISDTEQWLVVEKPAGWHAVSLARAVGASAASADAPDVESWLRARYPWAASLLEAGLVHRLDQATSGCLMAAKSAPSLRQWRTAFQTGEGVEKRYLALVKPGLSEEGVFRLFFMSRHKRSKKITAREQGEPRHQGRCAWHVRRRGQDHDLIEIQILGPGRRHQIRAGLAALGHPIEGDELYGSGPSATGLALHAWKLTLESHEVECAPPAWATL